MDCLNLITVCHNDIEHRVPCGKCAFCLVNRRSQWMFRVFQEMKCQDNPGWFLTLTYDERHVKRAVDGRLSLRFRDVQLFIKKLRKAKWYVKYICVGEYGSKTRRPHYHMLVWTDAPLLQLERLWSDKKGVPLGKIHFGRISMQSAMYTLKYIIQPKQPEGEGIERTRAQFSKGIGLGYLSGRVYDYHTFDYDEPVFVCMVDGRKVALPKYYKYKIFTKWQMRQERIKLSLERWKKKKELYRDLRLQGIQKIRQYLAGLRREQARRIIEKSKFNEII